MITPDPARISFEPEKFYLTVKWTPKIPASHKIEITYQNRPLKNSPWTAHWINSRDYTELNHPDFKPVIIGREGTGPGEFSRPWGVCALPNGRFAVADRSNNRKCIEKISPSSFIHDRPFSVVSTVRFGSGQKTYFFFILIQFQDFKYLIQMVVIYYPILPMSHREK